MWSLTRSPAENPRAIRQGMHSVDLTAFCSQSQCTRRNTEGGSCLAQVEPGIDAVHCLTVYRDLITRSQPGHAFPRPAIAVTRLKAVAVENTCDDVVPSDQRECAHGLDRPLSGRGRTRSGFLAALPLGWIAPRTGVDTPDVSGLAGLVRQARFLRSREDPTCVFKSAVVDLASTGEEAMELAQHYEYDIMLLDLMLPDMEGCEVLRRMRLGRDHTPELVLSDPRGPRRR